MKDSALRIFSFSKLTALFIGLFLVPMAVFAQDEQAAPQSNVPTQESIDLERAVSEDIRALAEEAASELDRAEIILESVETILSQSLITPQLLSDQRDRVETAKTIIESALENVTPELDRALLRVQELTPSEAETGIPESPDLIAERAQEQSVVSILEAVQRPAQVLNLQAETLLETISERRLEQFTEQTFERTRPLVAPGLWGDGLTQAPVFFEVFGTYLSDWWQHLTRQGWLAAATPFLMVLFVFVAARPLRKRLLSLSRKDRTDNVPQSAKILSGVWIVLIYLLVPAVALAGFYLVLQAFEALPQRFEPLFYVFTSLTLTASFVIGLLVALLSPYKPAWRITPVQDGAAEKLVALLSITIVLRACWIFIEEIGDILRVSLDFLTLLNLLSSVFIAAMLFIALRILKKGLQAPGDDAGLLSVIWRWLVPVAWLAGVIVIIAAVMGFGALAAFIIRQMIWSLMVVGTLFLLLKLVEKLADHQFDKHSASGDWIIENIGTSPNTLAQIGVVVSGIIKLILLVIAVFAIAAPFGVESRDFVSTLRDAITGFQIGNISISITSILLAIVLFAVALLLTRSFQKWLETRYLPTTSLDDGLKTSIRTAVGYIGVVIAAMFGFSYMGLNLENVAIVAGALSVGIGFGLQSIVSNFVSGLILLAERPFKAGDWVVVGAEQGLVKKVSVRATEVETFDKASILIPNSDFISGTVKNMVHGNRLGRVIVPVGVSYDSDPQQVRNLLMEVAKEHPLIMDDPEPRIFFMDFGASSLDFHLYAYLSDIGNSLTVRSDLRFAIFARLKEAGVEIPFPQQDLHIKDLDRIEQFLRDMKEIKTKDAQKDKG
jgi:potassium efflux system protein